jgi:DNA transformation protein
VSFAIITLMRANYMSTNSPWLDELLSKLTGITYKRMFGAIGLYYQQRFFAIFEDDRLYFKRGQHTAALFDEYDLPQFTYPTKQGLRTLEYYEVPESVLHDFNELKRWIELAAANSIPKAQLPSKPTQLLNLGPKSKQWLAKIGLHTLEDLKAIGARTAYDRVVAAGHPANLNLLYGLIGAVQNRHWREVAIEIREEEKELQRLAKTSK